MSDKSLSIVLVHGGFVDGSGWQGVHSPAWKSKPTHYIVATDDHMIPPPAQRQMAQRAGAQVSETGGSHAFYVANPQTVADVIAQAALAPVD